MLSVQRTIARSAIFASKLPCARTNALNSRAFSRTAAVCEAQLFDMPSMSPTMEEGGIVEWKVKQGDSFSAGDVLLEIETDKAEIAVEAGDDGILAKILVQAGEKGIPVGKPIAVTAEPGDDVASIDVESMLANRSTSAKKESSSSSSASSASSAITASSDPADSSSSSTASSTSSVSSVSSVSEPTPSHGNHGTEPLPAAARLLHANGLDAKDIKGTGPFGRITKGDVLAHLGKISQAYVAEESTRFAQLQKMDLSNIKVAAPKPQDATSAEKTESKPKPLPLVTSVSIPIDSTLAGKVSAAYRIALRASLLSLKARPSVLRDPVLDALTSSSKPPFVVKSAKVTIHRAKPVSYDVVIEEPPAPQSSPAVDVFITRLRAELSPAEKIL